MNRKKWEAKKNMLEKKLNCLQIDLGGDLCLGVENKPRIMYANGKTQCLGDLIRHCRLFIL
ncbi:hypothetical protein GGR08_000009 [Bartonella fuyuanensis]|uniref:Uncharacterized protein n=1 Tax=Bartonella fuyuanensis TaxID=1460968 RepID=A0A840E0I4_9HYPH|nr:hypothetical protein [Bartonella fuyuanensis]